MKKRLILLLCLYSCLSGLVDEARSQKTSDIRSDFLKRKGYTESLATEGRELLMRVAKNSGYENWQQFTTAEMISVDEWAAGVQGWWPESKQRFKTQALLGTFTSRVTLLEGAGIEEIWGIQAWHGYKKVPSGEMGFVTEKAISFYLPTLHYFNELIFRLLEAEYLAYAGEKTHNGKEESYGTVAVFEDLYGNKWDLLELKEDHPISKRTV